MKRRDFLKLLGTAVITPGTVIATVKAKPELTEKEILLQKLRRAFKETKFKRPISNTRFCVIYDEFDYTTINFLKKHGIDIKNEKTNQIPKI